MSHSCYSPGLGFTVFAGCLLADKAGDGAEELRKLASPKLHVIQLDVTKQEDWDKCKEYIKKNTRFNIQITDRPQNI